MNPTRSLALTALLALSLSGCGNNGPAPTLDAATDATAEASLDAMTKGMDDTDKKRFREDCQLIGSVTSQFDSAPQGEGPKGKLRALHGLTAEEIRARAIKLRAKLSG